MQNDVPAVTLDPVPITPEAVSMALQMKRASLGPYIETRWGWDQQAQERDITKRWTRAHPYAIRYGGQVVGILTVECKTEAICIEELYVLPKFQGNGIGGNVLHLILCAAASTRRLVTLTCIRWNEGALRFYRRNGFVVASEGETHLGMTTKAHE